MKQQLWSIRAGLRLAIAMLSCLVAAAQVDVQHMSGAGQDIRKIVIADGIYQFMTLRDSYVRQLNSVVIVNRDDVLVFDTNTRPSSARLILAEIRKITDKPVRYVVNSHWHPDHWSGNEVYAQAFPGLEIIATVQARQFMENIANSWPARFGNELQRRRTELAAEIASGKSSDGTALTAEQRRFNETDVNDYATFVKEAQTLQRVYPTITYQDQMTMHHGGREFRFLSVTGDAEGTTVLYLPNEKVIVTGDAVSYPIPYVTPPPTRQIASLRRLAQLDVEVIVPGHGPAFHDKSFLNLEIALLETVVSEVRKALQQGALTLDEVRKLVVVEQLREPFTHGDADLNARFDARVKDIIGIAISEQRDAQGYR